MNAKKSLALASTSVVVAGMAHGDIIYSGSISNVISGSASYPVDLNNDFSIDYIVRFDGVNGNNQSKPFINSRAGSETQNPNAWVLAKANTGEPVTPLGTMIDANYAAAYPTNNVGYLYQDWNTDVVGDWPSTVDTKGYVGVELTDGVTYTNYGWVHLIYQASTATKTIMVVDYAYENTSGKGIVAGMTTYAPTIYQEPQSQTNGAGSTAEFKVVALGDPPPAYQWMAGAIGSGVYTNLPENGHFTGTTAATLTINPAIPSDDLDYIVVVTNSFGAVTSSPPATLISVPAVLAGPTPAQLQLFQGVSAHLDVSVVSGTPTGFQWRKDGGNLTDGSKYSGSTTSDLVINSLAPADAGNYDLVVATSYGSVTSSVSPLVVVSTNGEPFVASELASGPLAYYRLNETNDPAGGSVIAYDNVSALNGVYGVDVHNGNPNYNILGPTPTDGFPGFTATNAAAQIVGNDANSAITLPSWNLNTNLVTITAWINPQGPQVSGAGVVYTRSTNLMVCGIAYYDTFGGTNYSLGYNWNDNSADYFWNSGLKPPTNQWSFIALVITPTNGTVYLMNTNGISAAVNTSSNAVQAWNDKIYIGTDPRAGGANNFNGKIDEVAVFNRALSSDDLQWLYSLTAGNPWMRIVPTGTNLQIQWTAGTLLEASQITGPWTTNNSTSPYLVTPTGAQKFYRAVVP
jgi:Concanavalin A-like lectin/glucanases superfamily/Immunoglobulin I-set domain